MSKEKLLFDDLESGTYTSLLSFDKQTGRISLPNGLVTKIKEGVEKPYYNERN